MKAVNNKLGHTGICPLTFIKNLFHPSQLGGETSDRKHMSFPEPVCYNSSSSYQGRNPILFYILRTEKKRVQILNTFSVPVSARLMHWSTFV